MSHPSRHQRLARRTSIAFSMAAAVLAIGSVSAAERSPVLSKAVSQAMKRDLGLSDRQLTQYFTAERTAYANQGNVAKRLGDRYAGSWLERDADGNYRFVAGTTGAEKSAAIDGIELRKQRYSMRQLQDAVADLNRISASMSRNAAMRGIHAWGIDAPSNSIVVTYAPGFALHAADMIAYSSADAGMFRFETAANGAADSFAIVSAYATVYAGNSYDTSFLSCSIGFTVSKGPGLYGFLTAGHCAPIGATVFILNKRVGHVQKNIYGADGDMAVIDLDAGHVVTNLVNRYDTTYQIVTGRNQAPAGANVCRSGRVTGWRCGKITLTNVSTTIGGVRVNGLTKSTACAGGGDSGGPWITGSGQAQGLTSGGVLPPGSSNNCGVAVPETYFQPLGEVLSRFGLALFLR